MPLQLAFTTNGVAVNTAIMPERGAPTVTGFSPLQAPVGTSITFFGSNFVVGQAVRFNGTLATISAVLSSIAGTATVPVGATTGKIRVTTSQGFGDSENNFVVGALISGSFSYLQNVYAALPTGQLFNGDIGYCTGTTVDTTEPTWAFTVALSDTGNQVTNRNNLQTALATAAASQTGHTKITAPAAFRYAGRINLPTNNTGFYIGLYPAVTTFLPAHIATVTTTARPKKVNRIDPSLLANMPGGVLAQNADPHIGVALNNVKKYIIRGWQFTNPSNLLSYAYHAMLPDSFGLSGLASVVSTTPNSVTFNPETSAASFSDFTVWLHRGPGATQIFHHCGYNGGTKTLTLGAGQSWSITPTTADRWQFYVDNPASGSVTNPSTFFPEDVFFIQCYNHGGTGQNVTRAYQLSGRRVAVVDGYTESLGNAGTDSQDVFIYAGQGPFKYDNCFSSIGGPKENIIIGGASLVGIADEFLPSDVSIARNVLRFAGFGTHKCSVEIKYGRRVNIENNDASSQPVGVFSGEFVVKLTDQGGDNLFVDTADVTLRLNRANAAAGLFQITSIEFYSGANRTRRIDPIGNLCMNPIENKGIQIAQAVQNIACQWNTVCGASSAIAGAYPRILFFANAGEVGQTFGPNVKAKYNVLANWESSVWVINPNGANFPVLTDNMGTGAEILTNLCTVVPGGKFAAQVAVNTDFNGIGFTNRAANNGALTNLSAGYQAGPGAKDLGAPCILIDALLAETV